LFALVNFLFIVKEKPFGTHDALFTSFDYLHSFPIEVLNI